MGLTDLVASDNSTVVSYINKQGGTRSIQLCRRANELLLMCQANQIVLRARHIPGRLNVLADILSRPSQTSGTEWSLHPSGFRVLTREWGIPLLDLFATRWNHKRPLFVSPVPDPSAMAVDALSMSWKPLWVYAYPPPALLPRVLEKAQQDQCELILIATHWPQAIWFPLLLGMLVQSPLRIPHIPRLLSQPLCQIHRDPSNFQLHAWRVSGMPSAAEAFRLTLPPVLVDPSEGLLWRSMNPSGGSSLVGVTYNTLIHSRLLRV